MKVLKELKRLENEVEGLSRKEEFFEARKTNFVKVGITREYFEEYQKL